MRDICENLIEENSKFNVYENEETYFSNPVIYSNGVLRHNGTLLTEFISLKAMMQLDFELIEEPEPKGIEELENEVMKDDWRYYIPMFFNKINELVNKVNELDRKINKKYCCNCGVELDKNNTALPNMCKECKYGEE